MSDSKIAKLRKEYFAFTHSSTSNTDITFLGPRNKSSDSLLAQLTAIRAELTQVSNNAKRLTYFEMREIRLRYKKCLDPTPSSKAEKLEVKTINKLLTSIKSSHPEICSKLSYKRYSQDGTVGESTFNSTQQDYMSKTLVSSYSEQNNAVTKPKVVKTKEDLDQLDEKERFELCKRWAIELRQKLAEENGK